MVKLLLEAGKADIEWKDKNNRTPLLWAIEGGHKDIVKLLLKAGVKVNYKYTTNISKSALGLVYISIKLITNSSVSSYYSI